MSDPRGQILFLSKGDHAASTRYRALGFFPMLEAAGYQPIHLSTRGGLGQQAAILKQAKRSAVTICLRRTFNGPFRYLLRRAARRLVFDFDDAIYTSAQGPSPSRLRHFRAMVSGCDCVCAGNETLADQTRAFNRQVHVLPTCLDLAKYVPADPAKLDPRKLVWIGSRSTRRYITDLLPALERAADKVPGLSLRIIADFELTSDKLPIESVPWSSQAEARLLAECGIGLAPLSDDPWTRGKCGFKLIQYMAARLPALCSPIGANAQIVVDGQTGLHASGDTDWPDAIQRLCAAPQQAGAMGQAGRKRAEQQYSLEVVGSQWLEVIRGLLEGPR